MSSVERVAERESLLRVNEALVAVIGLPASDERFLSAIHLTFELWTIFGNAARSPNNRLPEDVKNSIASLSQSMIAQCIKAAIGKVDIKELIKCNEIVADGLLPRNADQQ